MAHSDVIYRFEFGVIRNKITKLQTSVYAKRQFISARIVNLTLNDLSTQIVKEGIKVPVNFNIFPQLSPQARSERIAIPKEKKIRIILDTDAKNEIDDQFAITFALLSEKLQVEALYATQFSHDPAPTPSEGMELSYKEILTIQDKLGVSGEAPVLKGVAGLLEDLDNPPRCEATDDLIQRARAMDTDDEMLYVVAIGAITNIASAILLEPKIIEKIILVWLGGNTYNWKTLPEYNLSGDFKASQAVFDLCIPLIRFPCFDVVSTMLLNKEELNTNIRPYGTIGAYLGKTFDEYPRVKREGRSCIWDLSTVAFMEDSSLGKTTLLPTPRLMDNVTWDMEDKARPLHRVVTSLNRDAIFESLYKKLKKHAGVV